MSKQPRIWRFGVLSVAVVSLAVLAAQARAALIGFEAENGDSVTTSVTATIGGDYLPSLSDEFALGGEYLGRSGNGETGGFPGTADNLLSYAVDFAEAGEYDLYARLLMGPDGTPPGASDDSFYYGNGFGVKSLTDAADWIRPNGLPDAGFPASTYFWINLSENIGNFGAGTPTTFTTVGGTETIQFGGREDGLRFDAFAFGTSTDVFTDQQLNLAVTNTFSPPNQWDLTGGGNFNTAGNWSDSVVPTFDALFGDSITRDATIVLDSSPSLNSVTFNNTSNQYTVAGPNTLTLVAAGQVLATGTHEIAANVAGSVGLTKLGPGTLVLSGAKSYTGTTDVQEGVLHIDNLDAIDNQASGTLNIDTEAATVSVGAGANGTLAAQLTGIGTLQLEEARSPAETVTISRSNSSFDGVVRVNGGTLAVGNSNALGLGGLSVNRTVVQADTTAKIALSGGVTISDEVLDFEGRSTADAALTSSGTNAWNGVIRGEGNNQLSNFNIESTSGTLTLNELYAEDSGEQFSYVFSGAGNTRITGRLSDADIDVDTLPDTITPSAASNVGVVKRGSGTLTIDYASTDADDYWFGPTTVEEGTMVVSASGNDGELRSTDITVKSGAKLDVSAFGTYSQQVGQTFRGSGEIDAQAGATNKTFAMFDDGSLAPGDAPGQVGTLSVTGNASLGAFAAPGTEGTWQFDVGNSTNSTGDTLAVSGSFTASSTPALTVNVSPANGNLDAGSYAIVTHAGGNNSGMTGTTAQITDAAGNPLVTRQTATVQAGTNVVNVMISGSEESRTWSGNVSGAWDVSTSNWTGGDQQFRDLDHVTFNDSASTKNVTLAENRAPGSMTFANSTPYNFSGPGAIVGSGPINVTGSGEVTLGNEGNNFSGATTINAGSSLRMASATTGSINNSGTLSLGIEETIDVLVQNGAATIGTGGYRVFAFEAEEFQGDVTENAPGDTTWTVRNDIPGSFGAGADGEALYASEAPSNTNTSTAGKNFVTYNLKFTEPGSYMWFFHGVSTDGGNAEPTPNGDSGDDDSFYTVSTDMDSGNTDPTGLGSRVDNFGSGRIAAEGVIPGADGSLIYDWYRNGDSGSNANEFHRINVSQSDVDAGTVFKFKVGTREGGMTLDKFVFVGDADFATDPNFGRVTDMDLGDAISITEIQDTFIAAGNVLTVNGDFTMTADATLNMLVTSPSVLDQLDISGELVADGTLNIEVGGTGFAAQAGDVFDLFDFESASGSFTIGSLPDLTGALMWDTSSLLVTGEISVLTPDGDFDLDGDVDGNDFLAWQRNPGVGSLSDWQSNYGVGVGAIAAQATSVPEPSSLVLLLTFVAGTMGGRRRS